MIINVTEGGPGFPWEIFMHNFDYVICECRLIKKIRFLSVMLEEIFCTKNFKKQLFFFHRFMFHPEVKEEVAKEFSIQVKQHVMLD